MKEERRVTGEGGKRKIGTTDLGARKELDASSAPYLSGRSMGKGVYIHR